MKSNDAKTITSAQIRAGRALLKISAAELAKLAKVGVATVRRAENEDDGTVTSAVVMQALRAALESAGVEFIAENGGGPGVRLRKQARRR